HVATPAGPTKDITSARTPAPAVGRRIAEGLRRPAGREDLLQPASGEEPNISAIGRPERKCGSFGAGKRLRLERIERSHPHLIAALASCGDSDVATVGRYRKVRDSGFGRRVNGVLRHLESSRRWLAEVDE